MSNDLRHVDKKGILTGNGIIIVAKNVIDQIFKIGLTIISAAQWVFLSNMDQDVATDSDISANKFFVDSDSEGFEAGAGNDMKIYYDGTDGIIDTSVVSDSDLNINCGTDKTLELTETVWDDLQFSISGAKVPAVNDPTWEALTTNHNAYSFAVNDYVDVHENEIFHQWKEGTSGTIHIHTTTKTANSSGDNRFAKYTVYVSYEDSSDIWQEVSFSSELTIPDGTPAKKGFRLGVGTIDLTGLTIGKQIGLRVERVAATGGTEYADNIFITQVGIHLEKNTMGSRQPFTK